MSIERFFLASDGRIYRPGDVVEPGDTVSMSVSLRGLEMVLVARCGEEDEGGFATRIDHGDYTRVGRAR